MKRDDLLAADWGAPPEQIQLAVAAIEGSAAFRASPRHRALLRFLMSHLLDGLPGVLKETTIALEVFGRPPDRFDPRRDSIVRVETRRLRTRLAAYYASAEGRDAALRIELPVGSYVPLVARRGTPRRHAQATRRARDLVERGEYFLAQPSAPQALQQAIERFDQAQRESPTFAPAYVGLARAWFNVAIGWQAEPRAAGEHALEALKRALALDPDDGRAWALLGAVQNQFDYDWPAAQRSLKRALALAPQSAFVHTAWGWQLMSRGRFDEAERALHRARELEPQYLNSRMHMANLRVAQRRWDDAERELDALRDLVPGNVNAVGLAAALALYRGQPERAVELYGQALALAPGHAMLPVLVAAAHARAGRVELARRLLADALAATPPRVISPYVLAVHATCCGDLERAAALIGQALEQRDPQIVLFAGDPMFEPLHRLPAWPELLRRFQRRRA